MLMRPFLFGLCSLGKHLRVCECERVYGDPAINKENILANMRLKQLNSCTDARVCLIDRVIMSVICGLYPHM